jgi:hypothetical protein
LTHKHYTRLERLARDKGSSLFRALVNDGCKKFYDIGVQADDYILVDESESEISDRETADAPRWRPLWKRVRTAMVIEAPKDVQVR